MSYITVMVLLYVLAAVVGVLIVLPPFVGDYFWGKNGVLGVATVELVFGWAAFRKWHSKFISGFDAVDNARIRSMVSRFAMSILAFSTAAAWFKLPVALVVFCVLALFAVFFALQRQDRL